MLSETAERIQREARKKQEPEEHRLRRILRLHEVEALTGRKRSAIYEDIHAGLFPAPVPIGERAVGWLEDELIAWQETCVAARDERRRTVAETAPI